MNTNDGKLLLQPVVEHMTKVCLGIDRSPRHPKCGANRSAFAFFEWASPTDSARKYIGRGVQKHLRASGMAVPQRRLGESIHTLGTSRFTSAGLLQNHRKPPYLWMTVLFVCAMHTYALLNTSPTATYPLASKWPQPLPGNGASKIIQK